MSILNRTFTVVAPAHWSEDQVRAFARGLVEWLGAYEAPRPLLHLVAPWLDEDNELRTDNPGSPETGS